MFRRDLLILGAFAPELAPLRPALGDGLDGRIGAFSVTARATGIGLAAAAVGAAMHIGEVLPDAVVMIGTCGAYVDAHLAIGDVIVARRVVLADPAALAGEAQFPALMTITVGVHGPLAAGLAAAGAREADVATTLAITVDGPTAARIAQSLGAEVEHLETYGVAVASEARGIPFTAVLGIANFVGPAARDEWRAHHHDAATAAAERVVRWLKGGGSPLVASLK